MRTTLVGEIDPIRSSLTLSAFQILLVNHMTSKTGNSFGGDASNSAGTIETPALGTENDPGWTVRWHVERADDLAGETWSRSVTSRLVLGWEVSRIEVQCQGNGSYCAMCRGSQQSDTRIARVIKSPSMAHGDASFQGET